MRIIPEDLSLGDQCLTARSDGKAGLNFKKCEDDDDTQLISPAEIPSDVWALHVEADERTQDLHTAYSSYCGTSGALSNLDFGQIFVGDTLSIKTRCKFAPLVPRQPFGALTQSARCSLALSWRPALCEIGRRPTGPTGTNSSMAGIPWHSISHLGPSLESGP